MESPKPLNLPAASVSEALASRRSIRAFRADPVPDDLLRSLLERAARSPSGGNLQPWQVYVLNGESTNAFRAHIQQAMQSKPMGDAPEYLVYPENLEDPWRSRRRDIGEQLYGLLGIPREDKAARMRQLLRNYDFFDAPAAMFFAIDRCMHRNQWAHLGMFMQSLMLLAREEGLHTCPQEAWAMWHKEVVAFCGIPSRQMLYCGMAIGYADEAAAVNALHSPRAAVDDFASFVRPS